MNQKELLARIREAKRHDFDRFILNGAGLTHLPPEIGELATLRVLYLDDNHLTTLPPEIAKITTLEGLYLANNHLTTLPPEITKLTNLQALSLNSNKLTTLPPEITKLKNLEWLYIQDNPLTSPPPEIVSQGRRAIWKYLSSLLKAREPQWVSKLLVVGQGGAGKTNIIRRLRNEDFQEQEETTRGIAIRQLDLQHHSHLGVTMHLNTWDFAGQEIEHATHQFFLTNRSLFLVVWNARHGYENSRLSYWVETIRTRAGSDVPIILVATHIDHRTPELPLVDLRRDYPQILDSFAVSNRTGEGIAELRDALAKYASNSKVLPLMGELWPRKWLEAANAIRSAPESEKRITYDTLQQRMTSFDLEDQEAEVLTQWMHELGDILYFRDNEELKDLVILKPQWVTQNIARVFKSEAVIAGDGVLTRDEMRALWHNLDPDMRERLLHLMEQFDLSYRIPEHTDRSLVVERVPFEEPSRVSELWVACGASGHCPELTMKYELSSIPAGVPTWFIARQHRFTLHLHWRYGVLFGDEPKEPRHLGLLQTYPQANSLRLTVRGPFPINFFALLRDGLEETLKRFPGLRIVRKIPCPGHDGKPCLHEFDYDNLLRRIQQKPNKPTIECAISGEDISIGKLLTGIGWRAQDMVLKRLDEIEVANQAQHLETIWLVDRAADKVIGTLSDKIALAQREFLKEFAELQRLPESYCPNVFILRKNISHLSEFFTGQKLAIQLLCQEPGDWHPLREDGKEMGVYEIDAPDEWLNIIAPYARTLIKYLKWIMPQASSLVGVSFTREDAEEFEKRLKLMEKLISRLSDTETDTKEFPYHKGPEFEDSRHFADGVQLRVLRQLLDLKDPTRHWGGLERVRTPEGHYLWVCEHHARQYKR